MDFKQIQELIKLVSKTNISEITIENQDFRVKIKTGNSGDNYSESTQQPNPAYNNSQNIQQLQQPEIKEVIVKPDSSPA